MIEVNLTVEISVGGIVNKYLNNDFSGFRGKYATLNHCKNVTLDDQTQQNSKLTDVIS